MDIGYAKGQNSVVMDKNSPDPVRCWLIWSKAFQGASKYLYAGLEETGIDDTDFRILEALLNSVDRLVERGLVSRDKSRGISKF